MSNIASKLGVDLKCEFDQERLMKDVETWKESLNVSDDMRFDIVKTENGIFIFTVDNKNTKDFLYRDYMSFTVDGREISV